MADILKVPVFPATIADLTEQVQTARRLLDSEEAGAILASLETQVQDGEYGVFIRATRAALTMEWAAYKSFGLRETQESLRYGAQTQVILLDLVHKAYALGLKRGRGGNNGG